MISLKIEADALKVSLAVIGEALLSQKDPLTEVLELGLSQGVASIESQGAAFGDSWEPMSPWTPLVASHLYGLERDPSSLLMASGGLSESLIREAPGNIFEVDDYSGEAGTDYASRGFTVGTAQQYGTSRTFHVLQGSGFSMPGIPSRTFLSWREEAGDEYAEIFANHAFPEEAY